MKLIPRRKKDPTTFEKVTSAVKLGAKGLAAQRIARRAFRRYKFTKRVVPLAGLAAIGAVIAKKARGGSDASAPATSYTPPPASTGGAAAGTGASAGTAAAAAATAATGTPPADEDAKAGPEVSDALADAGVEGDGPDTPREAAAPGVGDQSAARGVTFLPPTGGDEPASSASGASSESPPGDASRTEEALEVEGPNQSTPPPPESTPSKS